MIRQYKQRLVSSTLVALLVSALAVTSVSAATPASTAKTPAAKTDSSSVNITQAVTQSYNADSAIQLGMIVKLKDKDSATVEPITQSTLSRMLGVVVAPNDSTVTVSPLTTTKQQVFVASSGRYSTLVSNQEGPIKNGDLITASALSGIGMKATEGQSYILGRATSSFSGTANVIGKVGVKDSGGKTTDVSIGRVTVDLDVSHNPLASKSTDFVPGILAKSAATIASRPVSAARIYLGVVTLLVTTIVTANLLYSGVRNGMIAVGRNPLSRKSIIKSLIQTVIAGLIIFIVGVLAVYLLLKL
ncbi:MAG: hypothetical protein QFB87_02230 [Patescibacteria group bacterium]|nr:hypothetical protein [Patescibacteria group bacterium]